MFRNFDFRRHVLPHLLAVLFFLVLTVGYFSPIFFDDKTLMATDILQFRGASKELVEFREATGEEALWTNSMFGGMPAYLISTRYTGDLIGYIQMIVTIGLPAVAMNMFLALLCGYVLVLVLGMGPLVGVVGAIAFAFSSYNLVILEAGHNTKSIAIAYMPLVVAGMILTFRRVSWRRALLGVAVFGIALALQLRVNHVQITYYTGMMMAIYGIVELVFAIRDGYLKEYFGRVALLLVAAVLALGVSFGRLYTTAEYGKYSIRGKSELSIANAGDKKSEGLDRDYAFGWSYGVMESMTLLIPDFYGGASQGELGPKSETAKALEQMGVPRMQLQQYLSNLPLYWGDMPSTSGPVYVGAIICFLFVLGLFLADKGVRYWLLSATILSLMLAWGKNFEDFNYFMFDVFPGYNKFRAVSMALVIAQVAMPLLGLIALWKLINSNDTPELRKKLLYAAGITGGLCVLVVLFAGSGSFVSAQDPQMEKMGFPMQALRADRESMMRMDALRSLFFIAAAAALLFFYLRGKLTRTIALSSLALLVLADLWLVDRRYLSEEKFVKSGEEQYFSPTVADQAILQDKDLSYRVFNVQGGFTSDGRTSYYHKSIGGYHGAKLRRYQDLIENHLSQSNMAVFNMLNTRYIITKPEEQPQRNPGALGNAWFVDSVKYVNNPDEELAALKSFNPGNVAVLDKSKFSVQQADYNSAGNNIKLTAYQPNHLTYEAQASNPGLAVFSEIYYKDGWNAYLDGKPVDHLRANYILRALQVPAGKHTIEFKFEPKEYALGNMVSLISSLLLLGGALGIVFLNVRKPDPRPAVPVV